MKKILAILAALVCVTSVSAQKTNWKDIVEIASVENEDTGENFEIVNFPSGGENHYYLALGSMGIGNRVIQVELDPVTSLYIPIGGTLADAISAMEDLKTLYSGSKGAMKEIQGSFKPFIPRDELETVKVYRQKILVSNKLQFVIERDGYDRVTYISKSDFNSLLTNLKLYKKLHKKGYNGHFRLVKQLISI